MIKLKDLLFEARTRFKKGEIVKIRRRVARHDRDVAHVKFGFHKGDFGEIWKVAGPGEYIVTEPGLAGSRGGAEDYFWDDELQKLTAADRRKFEKLHGDDDDDDD